jgi:hypothetical protein
MLWVQLIPIVDAPANALTGVARESFRQQLQTVELESQERHRLVNYLSRQLMTRSAETLRAEAEIREGLRGIVDRIGLEFSILVERVDGMLMWVISQIRQFFQTIIEYIVGLIWKLCVFIIFYLQAFFKTILVILGPIAIAFSILPAFRDSWVQWLSRYISVSLYGIIAYINLSIALTVMQYGIRVEMDYLQGILTQIEDGQVGGLAMQILSASNPGNGAFLASMLIGAVSMLTVPVVATWVIQTSGVGMAAGAMVGGAAKAVSGVAQAGAAVATKGASMVSGIGKVGSSKVPV